MANYVAVKTQDGYIHSSGVSCVVKGLVISATGATAGDVVVLRDGGPTGTVKIHCTVGAANGTTVVDLPDGGINFGNDCYYSEQATAANKIRTTIIL